MIKKLATHIIDRIRQSHKKEDLSFKEPGIFHIQTILHTALGLPVPITDQCDLAECLPHPDQDPIPKIGALLTNKKDLLKKLDQALAELYYVKTNTYAKKAEALLWQVREMLDPDNPRQKTLDLREESQEDQLEQESSTPNNDPQLHVKEQSQRTLRRNRYIVIYPPGSTTYKEINITRDNEELASLVIDHLERGYNVTLPNTWELIIEGIECNTQN